MEFGKKTLLLGGTCIVNRKVIFKDILPSFINQSHNHILRYSVHIPQTLQFIIARLVSDRRNLRLLSKAAPPHEKLREQLKPLSAAQIPWTFDPKLKELALGCVNSLHRSELARRRVHATYGPTFLVHLCMLLKWNLARFYRMDYQPDQRAIAICVWRTAGSRLRSRGPPFFPRDFASPPSTVWMKFTWKIRSFYINNFQQLLFLALAKHTNRFFSHVSIHPSLNCPVICQLFFLWSTLPRINLSRPPLKI